MAEHLTDRRLRAYLKDQLSAEERLEADNHFRSCSICRERMMDDGAKPFRQPGSAANLRKMAAIAVAGLFVVAIGVMFWWVRSNLAVNSAPAGASSVAPEALMLRDGNGSVTLSTEGTLDATYPIPQEYVKPILEALKRHRLTVKDEIASLPKAYPPAQERSTAEFRLLSPVGTAVISDHPTLTWEPMSDATTYLVTVYRDKSPVAVSPPQVDTNWAPPPLRRDAFYTWQVTAIRQSDRIKSTPLAGGDAAFYVVDEAEAARLEELEHSRVSEHLLLAVAFAASGVLEKAESELEALDRNNTRAPVVRELAASLRPASGGVPAGPKP